MSYEIGASTLDFLQDGAAAQTRSLLLRAKDVAHVFDFIPPSLHTAILAGTSTTDVLAYVQAALDAHNFIKVPRGVYYLTGALTINDENALIGMGSFGDASDTTLTGAPKLIFNGTADACIKSAAGSNLLYAAVERLALHVPAAGAYSWFINLVEPVGLTLKTIRCETTDDMGGIRTAKQVVTNSSWVNYFENVQVRIPGSQDGTPGTKRSLDIDFSDSKIIGGSFTGGIGSILRGTGMVECLGVRFDHATGSGLTISKETEGTCAHSIIGCQIELNTVNDILIDADANDAIVDTRCQPVIMGCQFRSSAATNTIKLQNATGSVMTAGPVISGNAFQITGTVIPISVDPTRWSGWTIGPNSWARTSVLSLGNNEFSTYGGELAGATIIDRWGIRLADGFIAVNYSGTVYGLAGVSGFFGVAATAAGIALGTSGGVTPFIAATRDQAAVARALDFYTDNTGRIRLAADGSNLSPITTDTVALGTTALHWSDLFMATGAVINFNNGNATITHSAGLLAFNTPLGLASYTVAGLPAGTAGNVAYASNGRKAGEGAGAGTGVLVFKDATNWIACDTGATVAA